MPRVFVYVTAAMTGVYVILGIVLLFSDYFDSIISGSAKTILGIVLLCYGLFRVYYIFKKIKEKGK